MITYIITIKLLRTWVSAWYMMMIHNQLSHENTAYKHDNTSRQEVKRSPDKLEYKDITWYETNIEIKIISDKICKLWK